jgi:hypothetical protein
MQAKEKHYERICNKRRHDDRRSNMRRSSARLNRSFEVSVLDYKGKTVNVSARGVYFEVITNDLEVFLPGATIPLRINAVTNMSEDQERKYKLSGRATVIRNCIIENPDHANRLGVALKFTEKLNTELDND